MHSDILVSIIIDTYNYGCFIKQAIDSALNQEFPAGQREIIVVDDGSTDDTSVQVAEYGNQVIYLRKSNGGQASAFNAGVAVSRGKIVCLLDADDYFYPYKLQRVVERFTGDPNIGIVYNRYDMVDNDSQIIKRCMPKRLVEGDLSGRTLLGYICGSPTSGISVLRNVISQVVVPEEPFRISADYFYLRILPLVARVSVVGTSQHAYRVHGTNLYLGKTLAGQQEIHAKQAEAIRSYITRVLNKEAFCAMDELRWIGGAHSVVNQVGIYKSGISCLMRFHAPLVLKLWTLAKMNAQLTIPPPIYNWIKIVRDRCVQLTLRPPARK